MQDIQIEINENIDPPYIHLCLKTIGIDKKFHTRYHAAIHTLTLLHIIQNNKLHPFTIEHPFKKEIIEKLINIFGTKHFLFKDNYTQKTLSQTLIDSKINKQNNHDYQNLLDYLESLELKIKLSQNEYKPKLFQYFTKHKSPTTTNLDDFIIFY